jgi:DNA-binding CsgD family transcriptional regulator
VSAGVQPTKREREVLALVAQGLENEEIAARLFIAKKTVEKHIEHLYDKLGATSRAQLVLAGLGDGAPPPSAGRLETAVRDEYLRCHVARCSRIDPRGARRTESTQDLLLPLEEVYISLLLGPDDPDEVAADAALTSDDDAEEAAFGDLLSMDQTPDAHGTHFAHLLQTHRWVVVLGEPGAGKTTLTRWVALVNARALLEGSDRVVVEDARLGLPSGPVDLGPARLPILIRAADFAEHLRAQPKGVPKPSFADFIGLHPVADEALPGDGEGNKRLISSYSEQGRGLLLVDGLDEVSNTTERREVVQRVQQFVSAVIVDPGRSDSIEPDHLGVEAWRFTTSAEHPCAGGNQVLITSRVAGYKQAALAGLPFRLAKILPLRQEAIERFAHEWAIAVERFKNRTLGTDEEEILQKADEQARQLVDAVAAPGLRRLAGNALLLTVLAIIHRERGRLPARRLDVYEEATRVLVERRNIGDWSFTDVVDILGPFASSLQDDRPSGHAPEAELRRCIENAMPRVVDEDVDRHVDDFIEAARTQAGLLVEVAPDRYGFMHGTFREYLAAREHSRPDKDFEQTLHAHLHDPRWRELLGLGVAVIAGRDDNQASALLVRIIDYGSRYEDILFRDLQFGAYCVSEAGRCSPEVVRRVTTELIRAGAYATEKRFEALRLTLLDAIGQVYGSRPRSVEPRLVEALREPVLAAFAVDAVESLQLYTTAILEALDDACHVPTRSDKTFNVRASCALALRQRGEELDDAYAPLRELRDNLRGNYTILKGVAPEVSDLLDRSADRVDPALYHFWTWILASVDSGNQVTAGSVAALGLKRARECTGADLVSMWSLAYSLHPVSASQWLMKVYESAAVDLPSAARCLTAKTMHLGPALLEEWLDGLPDQPLEVLLREAASSSQRRRYVRTAWRCLDGAPGLAAAAKALLEAEAVAVGNLEATPDAVETVRQLIESDEFRTLGAALLPKLRLRPGATDARNACVAMLDGGSLIARASAVMLAELPTHPITPAEYDLLAAAVADEGGPLRRRGLGALSIHRPADKLTDAVFMRSKFHENERKAAGDAAASHAHGSFAQAAVHTDADRVLNWLREGYEWAIGPPRGEAVNDLLRGAFQLDDESAERVVDACRLSIRSRQPSGANLDLLARLCTQSSGDCQREAAEFIAAEAVVTGSTDVLEQVATSFVETSPDIAVRMLRAAAWVVEKPLSSVNEAMERIYSKLVDATGDTIGTAGVGALLDVHAGRDPRVTLRRRTPSTATATSAIIFALDTNYVWLPATPSSSSLQQQIAQLAVPLSRGPRGMNDVLRECLVAISADNDNEDVWTSRRAALHVLNPIAEEAPAKFIESAKALPVEAAIKTVSASHASHSVRRLAVSVLSQFRQLNDDMVQLLAASFRDSGWVSEHVLRRCQALTSPITPNVARGGRSTCESRRHHRARRYKPSRGDPRVAPKQRARTRRGWTGTGKRRPEPRPVPRHRGRRGWPNPPVHHPCPAERCRLGRGGAAIGHACNRRCSNRSRVRRQDTRPGSSALDYRPRLDWLVTGIRTDHRPPAAVSCEEGRAEGVARPWPRWLATRAPGTAQPYDLRDSGDARRTENCRPHDWRPAGRLRSLH